MDSHSRRRHAPLWPPFKQSYRQLGSTEHVNLTPLAATTGGSSQRSSLPNSADMFSPDFNNSRTAYTPDPMQHGTPTALLKKPSRKSSGLSRRRRWFGQGWRASSKIALGCAVTVLITNICLTIGIVTTGVKMMDGVYMVYEGSCSKTQTKDSWVHLCLNIVATLLLASSNYCMQLLTSPTRSEVDKAHAKRKWLDIGIPSIRNLGSLRKKKVALWWILAISSVPLHLVYNSVFYSALATNNYSILYASQGFVDQSAAYNETEFPNTQDLNVTDVQSRAKSFDRLDNKDCIHAYARDFVEDRRNVIVVVKDPPADKGSLFKVAQNDFPEVITPKYNPFSWICDNPNVVNETGACCENKYGFVPCHKITPKLVDVAASWSTGGFEVDHCLSEIVESRCHLHFSLDLMGVVLTFNILKVIGISFVALWMGESPLVNIGDAIQSFLRHPDRTTEGMCLSSHESVVASAKLGSSGYAAMTVPTRYNPKQRRYFHAATWNQWLFLTALFVLVFVGTSVCLGLGIRHLVGDKTIANAWSIGFGNVKPENLVMGLSIGYGDKSIAVSTLIANTPQAIFSFLYVCYNALFTVMFLSRELSRFSVTAGRGRKYLRVTDPEGEQKGTYFLSLPYKYGIPLLSASGLVHWLVSQSVFLANISIIPPDGSQPMQDEITTVAYSPIAMLFILFVVLGLLVFLIVTAARKLPFGMPLIGSNSIAISAACHPPLLYGGGADDQGQREDMVMRPLNWGAVPVPGKVGGGGGDLGIRGVVHLDRTSGHGTFHDVDGYDYDDQNIGHCCFSDQPLVSPERGKLYA
ncbi:uncharacterized protein PV06_10934 [Exophiala oligosperma]|uniref:DUF6536 domain-containing protein n=1 Tax=Exophiala oligosperma TaxID=215243 RepID=A0A0D2BH45_9EURO|nr:uncharacterized protein PV06_10934 [Exophiala oligosperma]KIW36812.1 hypothetical protein PV06_10934 [Exophiala oligosperma]